MSKAEQVHDMVRRCLFASGEDPSDATLAEGVVKRFGFHPTRLAGIRQELVGFIRSTVPDDFMSTGGGGMSFLNLCVDRAGNQWAEHSTLDDLICLAIASGFASYCLPRAMWPILPGGVPYVVFNIEAP